MDARVREQSKTYGKKETDEGIAVLIENTSMFKPAG